jgi:hypothetical protein
MREDDPAAPTAGRAARRAICGLALPTQFTRLRRKMDAAVPQNFDPETKEARISRIRIVLGAKFPRPMGR